MDAVGTHSRYAVGSVDQNAHARRGGGDVRLRADGRPSPTSTTATTSCWSAPIPLSARGIGWRPCRAAGGGRWTGRTGGATIVVVDPLRTESAEKADVHLAVRPGQDWALLLAMVKVILDEGLEHVEDCSELATGVSDLRALVADADLDDLAARCDIAARPDRAHRTRLRRGPTAPWW